MKLIRAIIRPSKLDAIKDALKQVGLEGLTVIESLGFGKEKASDKTYPKDACLIDLVPRMTIEILVYDNLVEIVVNTISNQGRTGHVGDGLVFVIPVENVISIRTGETISDELMLSTNSASFAEHVLN